MARPVWPYDDWIMDLNMEPELIRASEKDIPQLLDMMERFYAIDGYAFDQELSRKNLYVFFNDANLGTIFLICLGQNTIGYMVLSLGFSFEYRGKFVLLDELFIEPDQRGKGFGRNIMNMLEPKAKEMGVRTIMLEVERHNVIGNRLYAQNGFISNKREVLFKFLDG